MILLIEALLITFAFANQYMNLIDSDLEIKKVADLLHSEAPTTDLDLIGLSVARARIDDDTNTLMAKPDLNNSTLTAFLLSPTKSYKEFNAFLTSDELKNFAEYRPSDVMNDLSNLKSHNKNITALAENSSEQVLVVGALYAKAVNNEKVMLESEDGINKTVVIVISVIGALVLLSLICVCVCRKKVAKSKKKVQFVTPPRMEERPISNFDALSYYRGN